MRITIEPTAGAATWDRPQHTVIIEHPRDDANLEEMLELLTFALRAYGFMVSDLVEHDEEVTSAG